MGVGGCSGFTPGCYYHHKSYSLHLASQLHVLPDLAIPRRKLEFVAFMLHFIRHQQLRQLVGRRNHKICMVHHLHIQNARTTVNKIAREPTNAFLLVICLFFCLFVRLSLLLVITFLRLSSFHSQDAYVDTNNNHVANGFDLGDPYYQRAAPVVDLQLQRAGRRMAQLFNTLFP
jgi:hypothetical protein